MTHSPSNTLETYATGATTIAKDTTLVLKGPAQRCFQAPGNIVKYDSKTNPKVWLEDYRLVCRAGGVNNDLFII
jgi:hypothetical protein